jgi:hypothetical protein
VRHLNYEKEKLISLEKYVSDLQKDVDDLEWDGNFQRADLLKRWLSEAKCMRDAGEVWYPLF